MRLKKNKLAVLTCTALLLFISVSVLAATIKLKNGRVLNGTIAERTKNEIKVVTSYGVITFAPAEIDTINGRKLSTPAPAKKSTAPKKVQKPIVPVKKKVTPKKAVLPAAAPVVAVDTTTPANVTASTETVPVSAPAKSPISLSAIIFAVLVIVITAVYIMLIIKRHKNRSNY